MKSPRHSRRSASTGNAAVEAAASSKVSYTVIPELLRQVKELCVSYGGGAEDALCAPARQARANRSLKAIGPANDSAEVAIILQDLAVLNTMLFPSLQRGGGGDLDRSTSLYRLSRVARSDTYRSRSCNSRRASLVSLCSEVFISKKQRRKAWRLLLHRSTQAFSLLVTSIRAAHSNDLRTVFPGLLSFLYNILHHIHGEKQRKAVIFSEKLGVLRTCVSVLQSSITRGNDTGSSRAHFMIQLRGCEAAALLFILCSTYNSKLSTMFRLSQSLQRVHANATAAFAVLENQFAAFHQSCAMTSIAEDYHRAVEVYKMTNNRSDTLKALRLFQDASQTLTTQLSNLLFSLFCFAKTPLAAKELGASCVELCAKSITMSTFFLSQMAPIFLSNVSTRSLHDTLQPGMGQVAPVGDGVYCPAWLLKMLRHVEYFMMWSVALLQRLCSFNCLRFIGVEVALRFHVARGLFLYLVEQHGLLTIVPRRECFHVSLLLLDGLLSTNRAAILEDIQDLGGLSALADRIARLPGTSASQWHQYYLRMCALYGLSAIPTGDASNGCYVDERLPAHFYLSREAGGRMQQCTGSATENASPCRITNGSTAANSSPRRGSNGSAGALAASSRMLGLREETPQMIQGVPEDEAANKAIEGAATMASFPLFCPGAALHVDTSPDFFSPELSGGRVEAVTRLPALEEIHFPWVFTDAAPPPSFALQWTDKPPIIANVEADPNTGVPLRHITDEHSCGVYRHQIMRLSSLNEEACDGSSMPHRYRIIYERAKTASSAALGTPTGAEGLQFGSNFESGNLQRVVEVSPEEYELVLSWDTGTNSYTQWFYFSIRNYEPRKRYRFNIVNMEKLGSTFNEGQKPLCLFVPDAADPTESLTWQRVGDDILYYRNSLKRPPRENFFEMEGESDGDKKEGFVASPFRTSPALGGVSGSFANSAGANAGCSTPPPVVATAKSAGPAKDGKQKYFFTLSFSVVMPSSADGVVYLTNCFPFTYSDMHLHIRSLQLRSTAAPSLPPLMTQAMCPTIGGLPVPLLTITAMEDRSTGEPFSAAEIAARPICVLVARVHPGETNASWVMQGLLDALLPTSSSDATTLLRSFVFKVIPMLNPDGVVMGNHRCSLAGRDMNRDYLDPNPAENPTIYALKQLVRHWSTQEGRTVMLFSDFHGHSRAKNFLVYGCTKESIQMLKKRSKKQRRERQRSNKSQSITAAPEKLFTALLSTIFPSFSIPQSSYAITEDKRGSARVVMYDEFNIRMSYGYEATMVGGALQTPNLLRGGATASSPQPTFYPSEVHYGPLVFRAMGQAFIQALDVLNGEQRRLRSGESSDAAAQQLMRQAWVVAATVAADEVEREGPPSSSSAAASPVTRVGPYALATRGDRRSPVPLGSSPVEAPLQRSTGSVTQAEQRCVVDALFMADQRLGTGDSGGDSTTDFDGANPECEVETEVDVVDANATENAEEGDADGAEGDEDDRSPTTTQEVAHVDSGSDDHDWSGYSSSCGGEEASEHSDDECTSINSIDEEIPTHLFL